VPARVAGGGGGVFELASVRGSGATSAADNAANRVRAISEAMTYQPRTDAGQGILEMASAPFAAMEKVTGGAGNIALEATGSPAVAAAVKTGLEMAPSLLFRGKGPSRSQRSQDIAGVESSLGQVGINLNKSVESQRGVVSDIAARATNNQEIRAAEMGRVQQAVQTAEKAAAQNVDNLYAAARDTNTAISAKNISDLPRLARESLVDYDIELMPIVQRRLKELDNINNLPENYAVRLNEIEKFKQRINRNRPSSTDLSQQAALGIIKGQVDNMLDAAFNSNMIKGDPAGIQAWRDAKSAFIDYKRTFDDQKVISQLAKQEATPEEVRNWIFGASALGAKKEAGRVIGSIKDVVGEASPAFGALRQEALFDIMEPLMREVPDYKAYVANYDKFVRNSPSVAKQLFPDSMGDLAKLRSYARAADKIVPQRLALDIEQTGARAFFGHGIAKAAMKVSIAGQLMKMLRAAAGKTEKQKILSEILGYDTTKSLIPVSPAVAGSMIQTGINEGNQ